MAITNPETPLEITDLELHSINDVFRRIALEIQNIKNATNSNTTIIEEGGAAGGTEIHAIDGALHTGNLDASAITYTPADLTDWPGSVDPGDVNNALDSLADSFNAGIDHGSLAGLADDDHGQYLLASQATDRNTFTTNWTDLTDGGVTALHIHSTGGSRWEPLTNGAITTPELIFALGDVIMIEVPT